MLNLAQKLTLIATLSFASAAISSAARAADVDSGANVVTVSAGNYGSSAAPQAASRTINLASAGKSVNVDNGDTVKFVDGERSFTWHFDTLRDTSNFDLAAIAPAQLALPNVRVYVGSNPLYRN